MYTVGGAASFIIFRIWHLRMLQSQAQAYTFSYPVQNQHTEQSLIAGGSFLFT
jgi:hypothetical protein